MILLDVQAIRKHFGPDPVLDGVTFQVRPGERIGLVGPNGCGKTTLLKILAEKIEPDAGTCTRHPSIHFGYLEQHPQFEPGVTLWDEAKSALAGLIELEQEALAVAEALAAADDEAERDRLAARYDHLQQELHRQDGYNIDHKIRRVLEGLGFGEAAMRQPAASLSGGEQNRLVLAKLLLAEPNLMLLDEPSNHLDLAATQWLEDFLVDTSATMILVSHDRYFLDKVTNRTVELFQGTVDSYAGNFSAYRRQKQERLLVQRRTYEKQQTEIAKTEDFIRRNSYGQKHAQAEDRRKKLARIERVAPPREIETPPMRFAPASRCGDIVLRAQRLAKSYDKPLFAELDVTITRGERWGLVGPNGTGKTTLLRCLLGLAEPDAGSVHFGTGVKLGYFDQQLASLHDDTLAVDAIRPPDREFGQQQRRNLLARFGLVGDTVMQPVGKLSGGERCRAALARLAAAEANVLVLDEPTNHLDLWACDALEQALNDFEGTVLFVTHDRHFLNNVADHLLVMEPERVRVVEGNWNTYQRMARLSTTGGSKADGDERSADAPNKSGDSPKNGAAPPKRKRRFPFRKVADLEADISERETQLEQMHQRLADGDTHRDGEQVRELLAEIDRCKQKLDTLYQHWEEAVELNW